MQPPDVLIAPHEYSDKIGRAFAKGCGGKVVRVADYDDQAEDVAFYGILRGTGDILKRRSEADKSFWYIDHGYIGPGHYAGHYRIVRSGLHTNLLSKPDYGRLLGLHWKPEKEHVALRWSPILIAPPSQYVCDLFEKSRDDWIIQVQTKIRQFTERPLKITSKDDDPGVPQLAQCWALVTMQSNLAVEAIRQGVPTFIEHGNFPDEWMHPAEYFADKLENIEDPFRPTVADRYQWGACLAAQQFTLVEIASGYAWRYLNQ